MKLSCVLFDLDGTLADTAPDLINSLNRVLQKQGLEPVEPAVIKPYISYGAAAMVKHSLSGLYSDEQHTNILNAMLEDYQENIVRHTRLFSGMAELLKTLENKGIKWGVVTNKRKRFTRPLMDALQLTSRAVCIISGDSTANSKPHPEPMLTACKQANVEPAQCLYIGDSAHDIEAGKKAGMKTMAAAYGYLKANDNPHTWQADALIHSPAEILPWIDSALCH